MGWWKVKVQIGWSAGEPQGLSPFLILHLKYGSVGLSGLKYIGGLERLNPCIARLVLRKGMETRGNPKL